MTYHELSLILSLSRQGSTPREIKRKLGKGWTVNKVLKVLEEQER